MFMKQVSSFVVRDNVMAIDLVGYVSTCILTRFAF